MVQVSIDIAQTKDTLIRNKVVMDRIKTVSAPLTAVIKEADYAGFSSQTQNNKKSSQDKSDSMS